jgi:hypothetical protein
MDGRQGHRHPPVRQVAARSDLPNKSARGRDQRRAMSCRRRPQLSDLFGQLSRIGSAADHRKSPTPRGARRGQAIAWHVRFAPGGQMQPGAVASSALPNCGAGAACGTGGLSISPLPTGSGISFMSSPPCQNWMLAAPARRLYRLEHGAMASHCSRCRFHLPAWRQGCWQPRMCRQGRTVPGASQP